MKNKVTKTTKKGTPKVQNNEEQKQVVNTETNVLNNVLSHIKRDKVVTADWRLIHEWNTFRITPKKCADGLFDDWTTFSNYLIQNVFILRDNKTYAHIAISKILFEIYDENRGMMLMPANADDLAIILYYYRFCLMGKELPDQTVLAVINFNLEFIYNRFLSDTLQLAIIEKAIDRLELDKIMSSTVFDVIATNYVDFDAVVKAHKCFNVTGQDFSKYVKFTVGFLYILGKANSAVDYPLSTFFRSVARRNNEPSKNHSNKGNNGNSNNTNGKQHHSATHNNHNNHNKK